MDCCCLTKGEIIGYMTKGTLRPVRNKAIVAVYYCLPKETYPTFLCPYLDSFQSITCDTPRHAHQYLNVNGAPIPVGISMTVVQCKIGKQLVSFPAKIQLYF